MADQKPSGSIAYFAYGTLLATEAMRAYCPTARRVSLASYSGHRLTFTQYDEDPLRGGCDLEAVSSARTIGVVFALSSAEMVGLDEATGVQHGWYDRRPIEVISADGQTLSVVTYFVGQPMGEFVPAPEYITKIRVGARAANLPEDYIAELDAILDCRANGIAPEHTGHLDRGPGPTKQ